MTLSCLLKYNPFGYYYLCKEQLFPHRYGEMANTNSAGPNPDQTNIYQIKVKGHLADDWSDWFDNMTITLDEDGETQLTGPVIDDAALHGILKRVRDLGLPLISVNRIDPDLLDEKDL